MDLHGQNLVAARRSAKSETTYTATNPTTGETLKPSFHEATPDEINQAAEAATEAFHADQNKTPAERDALLEAIAEEIEALGDTLVERVVAETALPEGRVKGERGRTTGQLRLFADVVREGSWVNARIDTALPDREPLPKPDVRRMLIAMGPVAVFGASNFPLAFSVAGGDTASALAAGCPVLVKAHPAHPGTSEWVAEAIRKAVEKTGFHPGTFSLLHGTNPEVSLALVRHPDVRAVGFTGSLRAGRALFDAAAARPEPIPVYAEMGSVNPLFVLPGALEERGEAIAEGLAGSVTLGAGQFCTNPGVVVGMEGDALTELAASAGRRLAEMPAFTMLYENVRAGYAEGVEAVGGTAGVDVAGRAEEGNGTATPAYAAVFSTDAATFLSEERLREEVFGPSTIVVRCDSRERLEAVARGLEGSLTATIHGTTDDLREHADLVQILQQKAGRLIFNSFPTGVEVCPSMNHGGPYPATTDVRSTSVGTAAIYRFARPICYQGFPQEALPPELRDQNERGLLRMINGDYTREDVG
ncbi:MAG: aldehyde dehydrogenase (NADP(+)) [Rhodothermales bacterium]